MDIRITDNREEIYGFLSEDPGLNLYLIGDLDDFFRPYTTWYALFEKGAVKAIALFYTAMNPPTLLAFCEGDSHYHRSLLASVRNKLPQLFNVHLSPGLLSVFGEQSILKNYGHNHRMILKSVPPVTGDPCIRRMTVAETDLMLELYEASYPGNWFDKRMVETGKYFGYFAGDRLAGVAGIHVFSSEYRIAALGNIATHPDFRGRKISYKLTSVLCTDLLTAADTIGLNVSSENHAAIKCYRNVGFEITGSYDECLIRNF